MMSLSLLFVKAVCFGVKIQDQLASIHNNKYYRRNKSKRFIVRYFYLNFKSEINPILFYCNLLLPCFSIINLVVGAVSIITEKIFIVANIVFILSGVSLFFSSSYFYLSNWITNIIESKSHRIGLSIGLIISIMYILYTFYIRIKGE